ncbi:hypothetical protein BDR04DRAFT_1165108 [Suillus decipiens]|nr:hypothetical protein BDR04DRAFT_1165108 [Suillus decipiens]
MSNLSSSGTTAVTTPATWNMPVNSSAFFPKDDNNRLVNEAGYFVWAHRMEKATLPKPSPGAANEEVWMKMDTAASALIMQCIKGELVVKIIHMATSKAAWDLFASEYSQIGSGSIIYWFAHLTRHMPVGGDPATAAIPLSTLPSDPKDPESWDYFIKGVKIDQTTTTLLSVINQILEEKRCQSPATDTSQPEAALAAKERAAHANGTKFC